MPSCRTTLITLLDVPAGAEAGRHLLSPALVDPLTSRAAFHPSPVFPPPQQLPALVGEPELSGGRTGAWSDRPPASGRAQRPAHGGQRLHAMLHADCGTTRACVHTPGKPAEAGASDLAFPQQLSLALGGSGGGSRLPQILLPAHPGKAQPAWPPTPASTPSLHGHL